MTSFEQELIDLMNEDAEPNRWTPQEADDTEKPFPFPQLFND